MVTKKKSVKKPVIKDVVTNRFDVFLTNDGSKVIGKVFAVIIDPHNRKARLDVTDYDVFIDIDYSEPIPDDADMELVEEDEYYPAFVEDGEITIYGPIPTQWVQPATDTIKTMIQ